MSYVFEVVLMDGRSSETLQWVKAECFEQVETYYVAEGHDMREVSIEALHFDVSENDIDLDLTDSR